MLCNWLYNAIAKNIFVEVKLSPSGFFFQDFITLRYFYVIVFISKKNFWSKIELKRTGDATNCGFDHPQKGIKTV